jgi:hypothetical protein
MTKEQRVERGLIRRAVADEREIEKQSEPWFIGYVNTLPHRKGWKRVKP